MIYYYDPPDPARQCSSYRDTQYKGTAVEQDERLFTSTTLYVGNLSYFTTETQVIELFSKCGDVKTVIMGLDRKENTPCGFCFVEYSERKHAEDCVRYLNGTTMDERIIRIDWDSGFVEGRQYGRGMKGGQVRDEHRMVYDAERGGFGNSVPPEDERESLIF